MSKADITLNLHAITKNSAAIDAALSELFATAVQKRLKIAEIITGKGSRQLMKQVKKWLQEPTKKLAISACR